MRIDGLSSDEIFSLYREGYEITSSQVNRYCDIAVSEEDSLALAQRFQLSTLVTASNMRAEREEQLKTSRSRASIVGATSYDEPTYIDYNTYVDELNYLAERYPHIMKLQELGESEGSLQSTYGFNQKVWGIKISDNVDQNEQEPGFLFVGETHARETQTFPITFSVLKEMLQEYETNPGIKEIVDNNQLFFVPLLNPNGYTVARTQNSMWRKNINDNGYSLSFNTGSYTGVDLNRNYRYKWGEDAPNNPAKETYRGPEPHSESEIQAVLGFIEENHIAAAITYHSYGEMVLMPYNQNSNTKDPVDFTEMRALGLKMANHMKSKTGYGNYSVGNAVELLGYGAGGGMSDHLYVEYGMFAYCYEVWDGGFLTPENQLPQLATNIRAAAKELIRRGTYSSLQGTISDNGKPVEAKIVITGLDDQTKERVDYYSDNTTGYYTRFLTPGTYTVTISPKINNYSPEEFEITVGSDSVTYLNYDFAGIAADSVILAVVNGTGSGKYLPGDTVLISANSAEPGSLFSHWSNLEMANALDSLITPIHFIVPSHDKTVTATYSDTESGNNHVLDKNWFSDASLDSKAAIDSSLVTDSTIYISFDISTEDSWASAGTSPSGNYSAVTHVHLKYESDTPFRLALTQTGFAKDGSNFGVTLPASHNEKTEATLPLDGSFWKRPSWIENDSGTLKKEDLTGIIFEGQKGKTTIIVSDIRLVGFQDAVGMSEAPFLSTAQSRIALHGNRIALSAFPQGTYRVRLFSLAGRELYSRRIVVNNQQNESLLQLPANSSSQIVICRVENENISVVQKLVLR